LINCFIRKRRKIVKISNSNLRILDWGLGIRNFLANGIKVSWMGIDQMPNVVSGFSVQVSDPKSKSLTPET